jgi:hypothetical protein
MAEFTHFLLTTCFDQVELAEDFVEPNRLCTRILMWSEEEARIGTLPPKQA